MELITFSIGWGASLFGLQPGNTKAIRSNKKKLLHAGIFILPDNLVIIL